MTAARFLLDDSFCPAHGFLPIGPGGTQDKRYLRSLHERGCRYIATGRRAIRRAGGVVHCGHRRPLHARCCCSATPCPGGRWRGDPSVRADERLQVAGSARRCPNFAPNPAIRKYSPRNCATGVQAAPASRRSGRRPTFLESRALGKWCAFNRPPPCTLWTRRLPHRAHPHPAAGGRGDGQRAAGAGMGGGCQDALTDRKLEVLPTAETSVAGQPAPGLGRQRAAQARRTLLAAELDSRCVLELSPSLRLLNFPGGVRLDVQAL